MKLMDYNADFLAPLASQVDLKAQEFKDSKTFEFIPDIIPFSVLYENSRTLLPKLMA